ncbi:hypothetical protein NCC49_005342 [Naganishia albida]|nr:hypothetical protein NCC49_005342 [Naganishia albida]
MSTFLGLPAFSDRNLSLYALPIVYMLAFTPHELKLLRLGTRYNNNKPRDPVKFREGDTETYKQEIEKLGGIHHNGMESWPLFAVTVAVANATHLPTPFLNSFALAYTASRVLYNLVYYNQIGFFSDSARTGIYVGGLISCLYVLAKCAGIAAGY